MPIIRGYVGTYASADAPGTYRFMLDTDSGALSGAELILSQRNTKYAAWNGGFLATMTESGGQAGLCLLDTLQPGCPVLDTRLDDQVTACFLTWRGTRLYSANYHDGHVLIYETAARRLDPAGTIRLGAESGCHQVLFHGRWLLVPCLCRNCVLILDSESDFTQAGELCFPAGTGPRHGVFTRDHTHFYLVSETSNQLFSYTVQGLDFHLDDVMPILPSGAQDGAEPAAVRLSSDEQTLYISVRGLNLIVLFRLNGGVPTPLQHCPSGGIDPWDLLLSPGDRFLLVSNRSSDVLISFPLEASGKLGNEVGRLSVPQCVGLSLEQFS